MRYGLYQVFYLSYEFAELSPRTLASSVGTINWNEYLNHDSVRPIADVRRSASSLSFFFPSPISTLKSPLPLLPSSLPFSLTQGCRLRNRIFCSSPSINFPLPWMSRPISSLSPSRPPLYHLYSFPVRHFSVSSTFLAIDKELSSSSSDKDSTNKLEDADSARKNPDDAISKKKSLIERFHKAYKNYGKVLIGFHCITYCIYFTSFVGISYAGLDVIVFLEWLRDHAHLPQAIINKITTSGAGHLAVAFILCKVISPIRYLTTIVGTKYLADYLRRCGYLAPVPEGDRIGKLAKESQQLIETRIATGRRRGAARMRKTNTAVKNLKLKIKNKTLHKRTPKPPPPEPPP